MDKYMNLAIEEAKKAVFHGDVPVGAVLVRNGQVLTTAHNNRVKSNLVTGHAEILVINKACEKSSNWRLSDCELYVTLKPCKMCQEVIREAKIKRVYYLLDPLDFKENRYLEEVFYEKFGENGMALEYRQLLGEFFESKR